MTTASLRWDTELIWEQLAGLLPGVAVEVVARIGSTNAALLERARVAPAAVADVAAVQLRRSVESAAFGRRSIDLQPCLLVAEHQTAGRGRQGRHWQAAAGASLTFSLALPLRPAAWSGLSLAVGVALADALEPGPAASRRLRVKWPNDIWLMDAPGDAAAQAGGRKLGGILIETVSAGSSRLAVVGIGLNVSPLSAGDATTGIACLQELEPGITAPQVLARVAAPLVRALQTFERDGFAAFAERFAARDMLAGRAVRTTQPGLLDGVAEGVEPGGELRVRDPAGTLHLIHAAEVSVRPAPAGSAAAAGNEPVPAAAAAPQPAAPAALDDAPEEPPGAP